MPSIPPNHKSDIGSLQSWNRSPQQFPAKGRMQRRLLYPSRLMWSRRFSQACSRGGGIACVRKTAGFAPRRLFVSKQAGPAEPGLWFKRFCWVPMASSAIMERSASNRAIVAAGGTAIALKRRLADNQLSGMHTDTGAQRRALPRQLRPSAAGRKQDNAQQDADRRLPPGGNTRCRRSR
ncbi:hypothetical protein MPLA_230007 [Mesorhizobium sp. ORS 3359]|nr:hypothetical protein MPLA_230007 [Mesorhizobium sp. ORS 3359]